MPETRVPVRRLVVRPPTWLGDAVLALPALAAIRRHFKDAHLTIAAAPSVAALFREETDVRPDRVVELPATTRGIVAMLKGGGFDLGILLPNSFRSAWQFRLARLPERWGYGTAGRGLLLTRRSRRPRGTVHQADYFRDLVRGLGIPCGDDPPRLTPSGVSAERGRLLMIRHGRVPTPPVVGFAPGAAYGQAKQWPPARMAEVMARLVRDHRATCVIVGALHDRAAAREIESWLRAHAPDALDRIIDMVGRTSLGALAGISAQCRVFVSNDSGAMHLAAAIGRPVVAIFGPTDERVTRPVGAHEVITEPVFCRPCLLRDCPIDHRCMKRITVDRVLTAVTSRLAGPAAV